MRLSCTIDSDRNYSVHNEFLLPRVYDNVPSADSLWINSLDAELIPRMDNWNHAGPDSRHAYKPPLANQFRREVTGRCVHYETFGVVPHPC